MAKKITKSIVDSPTSAATQAMTTPAKASPNWRVERSDLPLAAILIIFGVAVLALCLAAIAPSSNPDYLEREAFASLGINAFLMAFVGGGMMAFLLSLRRASSKNESGAAGTAPGRSFFREARTTTILGPSYVPQMSTAMREGQVNVGVKILLYLLAICIPAAGSIAGAALYVNAQRDYRLVGRRCIIVSLLSLIVLTALLAFVYAVVHFAS